MAFTLDPRKPLGRIRPLRSFDAGNFRVNVYAHKTVILPRFAAHFDKTKRPGAGAVVVTNWLAKCLASISMILENGTLGDCVVANLLHIFGALSGNETGTPALASNQDAINLYSAACGYVPGKPNTDNGCVITDVLQYAQTTGASTSARVSTD